ncbi:DUF7287 family protein [Haladaptatus salinisoli]|uniref:DUF7287 family protein n=1 Tax=Haladaptatus salinisoli TaxID=2884876 RepID=UPI001D0A925B|nr:hypothetical protein [Haladaptatus salinisoli]
MRGQTSIDFLVGMSVFLLTVAFVFAALPNTFAPFAGDDGADVLAADRVAAHLAEGTLAREGRPNVLNATCTEQFFDEDVPGPCHQSNLNDALGVGPTRRVNVTIESDEALVYAAGPPVPTRGSVVVASRLVSLGGEERTLSVRVW